MSDILIASWTIAPRNEPRPLLHCSRCRHARPFRSSGLFRLNANGKRLDAWLIYRCAACDNAWNRPIFERRPVSSVDPQLLASLHRNDHDLARRIAFDLPDLKSRCARIEPADGAPTLKRLVSGDLDSAQRIEISLTLKIAPSFDLRLDRLLGRELELPRRRLDRMEATGRIVVHPIAPRGLRTRVADGMRIAVDVSAECDRADILAAAIGDKRRSASPLGGLEACLP